MNLGAAPFLVPLPPRGGGTVRLEAELGGAVRAKLPAVVRIRVFRGVGGGGMVGGGWWVMGDR